MDNKRLNKNGVEIEPLKVRRMMFRIIGLERTNVKTKEHNDQKMIDLIQKIIEEEARCL